MTSRLLQAIYVLLSEIMETFSRLKMLVTEPVISEVLVSCNTSILIIKVQGTSSKNDGQIGNMIW